jgi:hypothetical protein
MNKYFPRNTLKRQANMFFSSFQNGCKSGRLYFYLPLTNFNFACLTVLYQGGLIENFSITDVTYLTVRPRRIFNRPLVRKIILSTKLMNMKFHFDQKYAKPGLLGLFYFNGSVLLCPIMSANFLISSRSFLLGTIVF